LLRGNISKTAIALYDPERHWALAFRYGWSDAGVRSLSYAAMTLWQLGYPDQALKRGTEALALAEGLSHPFSLTFAQGIGGAVLCQLRREAHAVHENAENMATVSAEHGLAGQLAYAIVLRGWAMAEQGQYREGLRR